MSQPRYSLADVAVKLNLKFRGDGGELITGLATLQDAEKGQLSFLANPNYAKYLSTTAASAVILSADAAESFSGNCLIADNPYLAFARATELFARLPARCAEIHPSACVAADAEIAEGVSIGAGAVIESGARIESGAIIGPNCVVGADVSVGANTRLYANVTLYYGVSIGAECTVHSGAVIGSDGFGFAPEKLDGALKWVKIYQLGSVVIGDCVEIGANTTVDRGALGDTRIGDGVKLDNQCQIAHNVTIGDNTAIAAGAGIAGSTTIGKNCTIAGCVGIVGHLKIADGVHITAMSLVTKSISTAGSYSATMPMMTTADWRKNAVRVRQLDKLARRLKLLEDGSKHNC